MSRTISFSPCRCATALVAAFVCNLVFSGCASSARVDEQQVSAPTPEAKYYVYYIRPVREALITEGPTPDETAPLQGHVAYIRRLQDEGTLLVAGPSFPPTHYPAASEMSVPLNMPPPGIVIFRAKDDAEAKAIMEGDPAVAAGVFAAQVNPFIYSFGEGKRKQ